MDNLKIGFVLTGSFCTFNKTIQEMEKLILKGYDITPIMSYNAYTMDTKFGTAEYFNSKIEKLCGKKIIHTIQDAEPIGPAKMFDVLVVAPCTGNTLAKLKNSISDTPATMAVKSHLRNSRPVVIAISSNDSLSGSGKNIGNLFNIKNYYFVPFKQDNCESKPTSIVADLTKLEDTIIKALEGKQIQPMIL